MFSINLRQDSPNTFSYSASYHRPSACPFSKLTARTSSVHRRCPGTLSVPLAPILSMRWLCFTCNTELLALQVVNVVQFSTRRLEERVHKQRLLPFVFLAQPSQTALECVCVHPLSGRIPALRIVLWEAVPFCDSLCSVFPCVRAQRSLAAPSSWALSA